MWIFYSHFYWFLFMKTNYLQVYLDNYAYKIADKWIINYLGDNLFESDED